MKMLIALLSVAILSGCAAAPMSTERGTYVVINDSRYLSTQTRAMQYCADQGKSAVLVNRTSDGRNFVSLEFSCK